MDDREIKKLVSQIAAQTAALVTPKRGLVCSEHRHIVDGISKLVAVQERQTDKLAAIHGDVLAVRESHHRHKAWHDGLENSAEIQISRSVYWVRMLSFILAAALALSAAVWAVAKMLP